MKKIVCGIMFAFVLLLTACGSGNQKKNGEISEEKAIEILYSAFSFTPDYDVESTFVQDPENDEYEIGYCFSFDSGEADEDDEENPGKYLSISYSKRRRDKETKGWVSSSDLSDDPNSYEVVYNSKGYAFIKAGFYYAKNIDGKNFNPLTDFKSITYKEFIDYSSLDIWQLSYSEIEKGYEKTDEGTSVNIKLKGDSEKSKLRIMYDPMRMHNSVSYAIRVNGKTYLRVCWDDYSKLRDKISQDGNKNKN